MIERHQLDLPPSPCTYLLGEGALQSLGEEASRVAAVGRCALVTDLGVAATPHFEVAHASLVARGFEPQVHVLPAGEAAKSVVEAVRLWEFFAAAGIERRSPVVALGGGAVGDTAGFCAATWMRGVPLIQVPTTLLAMADSAVGGKTAIDLPAGKNLVGAVHPAALIVADLNTLGTLPMRERRSGFAEVVKCALLASAGRADRLARLRADAPALLGSDAALLAEAIAFAVRTKEAHVATDLLDLNDRRALLNLGHTVAHALETEAGYGVILHGEAVSVGTIVALRVAVNRGLAPPELLEATSETLAAFGLPVVVPEEISDGALVARTHADKKRAGAKRRMVLPLAEGGVAAAQLFDVPDSELAAAISESRL